jgi:GMP synthase (glutamine-hydrolysing)
MTPFLIIQLRPEDATADDELAALIRYGGLAPNEVVRLRAETAGIPDTINPHDYAAIIVGGSPFDISAPETAKTAIQKKIEADFHTLLDIVVPGDIPFLGCCSGNGLLGSYCGVTISRTYSEPIGGIDINLTTAGQSDALLAGLPTTFRVLVGHKEACDSVPTNASLLATGAVCPVQMFRLGNNVYATQFHPEADAQIFTTRITTYKHHGYFPPETAADLIASIAAEQTPYAHAILRRFVERYRQP